METVGDGQLRAFISYAASDKVIAGRVRIILEQHGIAAFLAHEDIEVSQAWSRRIIEELERTDIFVALLSSAFRKSDWTAQECGIARARPELLCVPLSLDGTQSFGFMAEIQCERLPAGDDMADVVMRPIKRHFEKRLDEVAFSSLARQTRLDCGLSVSELARKTRLRSNSIRILESGDRLTMSVARKVARCFGLMDQLPSPQTSGLVGGDPGGVRDAGGLGHGDGV